MESLRVVLCFPKELADKPLVYCLVKEHGLVINILKALITPEEEGKMVIELVGEKDKIANGIDFLSSHGVSVKHLEGKIELQLSDCVHCGICTGVCSSGALRLDNEGKITLMSGNCTLCELCVPACPFGLIKIEF